MSIYKKEASLEEMKREAIRRMELLKLDARTQSEDAGDTNSRLQHSPTIGLSAQRTW